MRLIWSDGGYDGQDFIQWVKDTYQWVWQVVKRDKKSRKGNKSVALALDSRAYQCQRWGAIDAMRIDYEALPASSEAFIYAAMVRLMLRRLA